MCICSYAPTAVPMSPKVRPSASAASAPIQIADQLTGQFTTSHVSRTLSSGISRSSSYRSTHVPCHSRCLPAMAPEPREDLGRVELHEARLIGPYLVNTDVVVSGIGILLDGFEVPLGVRPAHHVLADFVFGHELGHRFKVGGQRQLPRKRGFHGRGGPALPRGLPGLGFVLSPADREREAFLRYVGLWPALAQVVLLFFIARTPTEKEASRHHRCRRGRGLRATMAGCTRIVGQVTAVPSSSRLVECAIAAITLQTKGLWP